MESFQLHQLTFGIKGILSCWQQVVGLGHIGFNACDHTVALEVTIIIAVLHQTRVPYQHTVVDPAGNAVIVVHTALLLLEHAIFVKDEHCTLTVRIVIIVGVAILTGDIDFGIFRIRAVTGQQICGRIRYTNHSGDDISVAVEIVERTSNVIPTSSVHNAILIICCALIAGKPSIELQDAVTVERIVALREQSVGFAQIVGAVGL